MTAAAVSLFALTAACGGGGETSPPPEASSTSTLPVPDPANKTGTPQAGAVDLHLTGIQLSRFGNADRVVYQYDGSAVPGWSVHYVDNPIQNGTKEPFPVEGKWKLEVLTIEAASMFNPQGSTYAGPQVVTSPGMHSITEVKFGDSSRGVVQTFIGIRTDQPAFRVTAMTNPTRIVVDIADPRP